MVHTKTSAFRYLELISSPGSGYYPNATVRGAGENTGVWMGRVLADPEITLYRGMGEVTGADCLTATYILAVPRCHYVAETEAKLIPLPIRAFGVEAAVAAEWIRRGCMVHMTASVALQSNQFEWWPSRQIVTYQPGPPQPLEVHIARKKSASPMRLKERLRTAGPQPWMDMEILEQGEDVDQGLPVGGHSVIE